MNIKKYASYFHDGRIINIEQFDNKIILFIESSEIIPDWNCDKLSLSNDNTIKGKLILNNVRSILFNDYLVNRLKMIYDDGEILRLKIYANKVDLFIQWMNFPQKNSNSTTDHIIIPAGQIQWENIPDLLDS